MTGTALHTILQHLRRAGLRPDAGEPSDGQLLERFVSRREGAALELLVRRHAPMVWGVCRRVLRDHHDTEDAFQATFLVLVRKAASIAPREMVGNWLYGVAHQTALKARATTAKQRTRERPVGDLPEPGAKEPEFGLDMLIALDQELVRLPDKYRVAIVLCDLEGKTRSEAARQLGVPEGTLAARVARARVMLGKRLARHHLGVSAATLAGFLAQQAGAASVPISALSATIRAAHLVAIGQATGAIAAPVATLTEGVLKAMLMTKIRIALGICLVVGLMMFVGAAGYRSFAADKTAPQAPKDRLADTLILLDKQWWEAAAKKDVDTLGKLLADDWVGLRPPDAQPDWTKAMCLDYFRRARHVGATFLTERRVVRLDDHAAIMTYQVKARTEGRPPEGEWSARIVRCWVQRDGGWFIKYTETVNLPMPPAAPAVQFLDSLYDQRNPAPSPGPAPTAWKRGVRASGVWQNEIPENAFDGKRDTDWNSGDYAPGWIERDLDAVRPLASIAMYPCQDIEGPTVHELWVSNEPIGNERKNAKCLFTFEGKTTNNSPLKYTFPKDLSARYVQVLTTQSPTWIAWWEIEIRVREEKVVPLKDDKTALQGTWQVVSVERGGKDVTTAGQKDEQWVVKDGFIKVQSRKPKETVPHTDVFGVWPEKSPKEIDINAHPIGVFLESDVVKGIYTLDGDVWRVCLRQRPLDDPPKDWAERPKEMKTKAGDTSVLITLKRVKP